MPLPSCSPDVLDTSKPDGSSYQYCLAAEIRALKVALASAVVGVNYFHNPEMSVQQRPTVTPSNSRQIGQVDRWAYQVGNASFTATAGSLGGVTVDNRQVLNATVAFTAANTHNFDQRLPAKDCWKFGDKAITVSAYVFQNSSASQSWYWEIDGANSVDNFSAKTTHATGSASPVTVPTGVWTRVTFTATLTNSQVANGLEFRIKSAASAGALVSHNVRLKDCQLEFGSTATTFSSKSFADALIECQCYWEKSYNYATLPGAVSEPGFRAFINSTSTNSTVGDFNFKVIKVKSPTITIYSPVTGASGKVRNENAGADENATISNSGENGLGRVYGTTTSAQTSFRFHYVANAEL